MVLDFFEVQGGGGEKSIMMPEHDGNINHNTFKKKKIQNFENFEKKKSKN